MQITTFDLIMGLVAVISLGFNFFQLYKERIAKQKFNAERLVHKTILSTLWQSMQDGVSSLDKLRRKGTDTSLVVDTFVRFINLQRIEVGEFLKKYYDVELEKEASPLNLVKDHEFLIGTREMKIDLIEGIDAITDTMIKIIEQSERFIFCVGGRARNQEYLEKLSERVCRGNIRYIRIITGDHIRHQLCEHLSNVLDHAELGYLEEDKYGGIIATDESVFLALYSSRISSLDKALLIKDDKVASDYRSYVQDILSTSKRDVDINLIQSLCKSCSKSLQSVEEKASS
jgi:hypothetical protein